MIDYKLLILDIDGTLIGSGAYATERVAHAIAAAQRKGVTVAFSTGRASEACYHLLTQLNLPGLHICFDGAAIIDWPSHELVFLQALPPRAAQQLIDLARQYELFLEIYAHDFYFIEQDGELARQQQEKLKLKPIIADLDTLVNRVKIVKGQILATNSEERMRADDLSKQLEPYCKLSWSFDPSNNIYFGNAVSHYVSKGTALREMIDYRGFDISQTLAIGDSFNDMPVFEVVKTKVAMGHAPVELKAIADWIAPTVDEDGVAVAIEKFILDR